MAFTRLKLTTFGQTIEAKRHQGKGIHFTRVAIGDGLLGNGSMINRTELVSERHSMLIDGILTTDDAKQSAVVATLDNSQFEEGFLYRELALMAQDPDTQEEGAYLYDNAGQECEYLDTQDGGVVIYERLKLLIRVEQTEQITFVASGNPLYLSAEDVQEMIRQHNESEDAHPDKADLGEDGKVLPEQLPEMDVSTAMAGFDTKDALADADGIVITDSAAENAGKRVLWSKVKELLGKLYVPLTRKINKKALSSDITLSAADVGAAAASHTHALDALTGILPVNKGGTGQSSLEALLAALKQAGAVQIATGSYVGTGTYGADHPCSLTFDFLPTIIWLFGAGFGDMLWNSQTLANKSIVSPGDLTAAFQKYPFPFEDGYQSGGGAYPYEYVLEYYAAFQNNTLRWYAKYTQKSGNNQPVEMDSAAYQLNAAGTNYGWIAFG